MTEITPISEENTLVTQMGTPLEIITIDITNKIINSIEINGNLLVILLILKSAQNQNIPSMENNNEDHF